MAAEMGGCDSNWRSRSAGRPGPQQAGTEEAAERTLATLRRVVPAAVPGIAFLSGGQSDEEATANLDAINKLGPHPWGVSFSYGRALQHAALNAWKGEDANTAAGQKAFLHRARMNGLARDGKWTADAEKAS